MRIFEGEALADEAALTGESVPQEKENGALLSAGSILRRGEIHGTVTATGRNTSYGRTVELVGRASPPGHLQRFVLSIIRRLLLLDLLLIMVIVAYALSQGTDLRELLPFVLILLIASIPVALPATYTLAGAVAALDLARKGVLVTRLSALEDAASLTILCSDKTGTITQNALALSALYALPPHTEDEVLRAAAIASEDEGGDPVDRAILAAAAKKGVKAEKANRLRFLPFDPVTKRAEAVVREGMRTLRFVKGSLGSISILSRKDDAELRIHAERLEAEGSRVLAVATGSGKLLHPIGLLAFTDAPREDAVHVIGSLRSLGIRVLMVTGDSLETAQAVARAVGICGNACRGESLTDRSIADCTIFARFLPEQKFRLVERLQRSGATVAMTGDGVNDAAALRQADVGIAVASATDVAKSSASLVLTAPGLRGLLDAVVAGREISRRMHAYTVNKIVKTLLTVFFLTIVFVLTGVFALTPRLMLLLLFTNDFVTMSLAGDRVRPSSRPDRWAIGPLFGTAVLLGGSWLLFTLSVFFFAWHRLHLDLPSLQTLVFVLLVLIGQATVYLVRESRHPWSSLPGTWLLVASAGDIILVLFLAGAGIFMAPLPLILLSPLPFSVFAFALLLDMAKTILHKRTERLGGREADSQGIKAECLS